MARRDLAHGHRIQVFPGRWRKRLRAGADRRRNVRRGPAGADLDGSAAGTVAVLMTVLAGSSKIPRVASAGRLRALGAASGALASVALAPRPGL